MSNELLKQFQMKAIKSAERLAGPTGAREAEAIWTLIIVAVEIARRLPPPLDDDR